MDFKIPDHIKSRLQFSKPRRDQGEPLKVEKIIYQEHPCEKCGKIIENEKFLMRKYQAPKPHWRKSCANCNLWMNPTTGEYDLTTHEANSLFRQLFSNKK